MTTSTKQFKPHRDKVFVTELERGSRKTAGGIILGDDDMKLHGIRERWGRVYSVGENVTEVKPGDWILIEHGRWSFGFNVEIDGEEVRLWHVDWPEAAILASDDDPRPTKAF
jgi:co-chaperonin GroES (HSP10)